MSNQTKPEWVTEAAKKRVGPLLLCVDNVNGEYRWSVICAVSASVGPLVRGTEPTFAAACAEADAWVSTFANSLNKDM